MTRTKIMMDVLQKKSGIPLPGTPQNPVSKPDSHLPDVPSGPLDMANVLQACLTKMNKKDLVPY